MLLYKACFKTKIGTLYYLWLDEAGGPAVAALTTDKSWMEEYASILKGEDESISVNNKRFDRLEASINDYLEDVLTG